METKNVLALVDIALLSLGGIYIYAIRYMRPNAKRLNFMRALPVAVGIGAFGAVVAVAQTMVQNVLLIATIGFVSALVGLYIPKTLGGKLSEDAMMYIGMALFVAGVILQAVMYIVYPSK